MTAARDPLLAASAWEPPGPADASVVQVLRPATQLVCALVVTHLVTTNRGRRCNDVYMALRMLLEYGATPLPGGLPALWEAPPARGAHPWTVMRHEGADRRLVSEECDRLRRTQGREAQLDQGLIDALVWPGVTSALTLLIADGPEHAPERARLALEDIARRLAPVTRARPHGGRMSKSTVQNHATGASAVFRALGVLAACGVLPESLQAWRQRPARLALPKDLAPANTDRSAPDRRAVRAVLVRSAALMDDRLQRRPGESRLAAIERRPGARLRALGLFRIARGRALLLLFSCVGVRVDAACRLRRCDVIAECARPDGSYGPALDVRPGKTLPTDTDRRKHLPPAVYEALAELDTVVRLISAAEGRECDPQGALLPGSLTAPNRHPAGSGMRRILVGQERDGVRRGALLPRADGAGYSPHALRHLCEQLIREGGALPISASRLRGATPVEVARVVMDQEVDALRYADIGSEAGRERLGEVGIQLAWDLLAGPLGARRGRDVDAYREALVERERLLRERDTLARGAGPGQALDAAGQVCLQDIGLALDACERRLHHLCEHESALVCVPDETPEEDLVHDLAAEEERLLEELRGQPPPLREWHTLKELTRLCELSLVTLLRCLNEGRQLPTRDRLQPFSPAASPFDESLGIRRRRFAVADLDADFLRARGRRELSDEIRTAWPKGWSQAACEAPLRRASIKRPGQ